jgi:hypothetical protein
MAVEAADLEVIVLDCQPIDLADCDIRQVIIVAIPLFELLIVLLLVLLLVVAHQQEERSRDLLLGMLPMLL